MCEENNKLPDISKRYWIKGSNKRYKKVINALLKKGANNNLRQTGKGENNIYFIGASNEIKCCLNNTFDSELLKRVYLELESPDIEDLSKSESQLLPSENMRFWINGNKQRCKEVIKALLDLGADNKIYGLGGSNEEAIYYINGGNHIDSTLKDGKHFVSFIRKHYKEFKLPWKPNDKELAWCWNGDNPYQKVLAFYDKNNDCVFMPIHGNRNGYRYEHYSKYFGKIPQWAKDAFPKLEL